LLDERNGVSYPDVAEKDGYIYITYDRERGCNRKTLDEVYTAAREILVAKINEGDIINGSLVSEQGFLKRIVSKLGRLLETDRNPFEKRELSNEELAKKLILQGGNVIEESFALFPFNCTSVYDIDVKKVESLIKKFEDSGNSDEKLLAQIISIIRAAPKQAAMENPIIDVIKNYIEEHITEDFLVSELAEKLNISVYYLCHMFKAVTGITVTEYCNSIRITNAKHLLIRTDETVNGIAQKCGFCTAAYFSEVFVRLEKISPSEYRRIHKKEQLK